MSLLPFPVLQFCDQNGKPYAGGTVESYEMGTFTPKATYLDLVATIPNEQPVTLDSSGRGIFYGTGVYRLILRDQAGNLIFDGNTEAYLGSSAISPVMLPVTMAATLAEARRLMGIDDAIQLAVDNIQLMPGATGPVGPAGPKGDQGIAGPPGDAAGSATASMTTNGYWYDPGTGMLMCWGSDTTPGGGFQRVNFAKPYTSLFNVQATPLNPPFNITIRAAAPDNGGVTIGVEDTDNHGGAVTQFYYLAIGYASSV